MKPKSHSTFCMKPGMDYGARIYQSSHMAGAAIMGSGPSNSVVNRHSQSRDLHNLFVYGASSFPQNIGYNPAGLPAALTHFSAEKMRDYLKIPRALVDA